MLKLLKTNVSLEHTCARALLLDRMRKFEILLYFALCRPLMAN